MFITVVTSYELILKLLYRKCPDGVKSCFYADGRYEDQGKYAKVLDFIKD